MTSPPRSTVWLARAPAWFWVLAGIGIAVLIYGGLQLVGQAQRANSPEAKCRQVMADVERERAPATIAPDIWLSVYNDCVARERGK